VEGSKGFLQRPRRAILTRTPPGAHAPGFVSDPDHLPKKPVSQDPLGYRDAVFYELYAKAFE
jgi:hypothetical protein